MDQVAVLEYVFTDVYQPELSGRQTTMPPCFLAPPPLLTLMPTSGAQSDLWLLSFLMNYGQEV